ncbi:MAG: hypothetical protein BWX80_02480 [Candidatus Hydrogenedentes bacterium ADurb.Bin101]|nr:MAG: hypothetical protein BWX80_02480 [Candidatus Hydrogenedentes bacterium ADurb.Bin101]
MALVFGVIFSSIRAGSRLKVSGSTSTKSISAPSVTAAAAVAIHVSGVVMTRSPGLRPIPIMDRNKAAVPLLTHLA